MKKLAILTSGGDAPGMNACLQALVRLATPHFDEIIGIMHGYDGLISGRFISLTPHLTETISMQGGTILKSSRSEEFRTKEGKNKAKHSIDNAGITHLVVIGGNGTTEGIYEFSKNYKINFVVIPSTIDNDTFGTDLTLGHLTATQTIVECMDRLKTTSSSHDRIFFLEVMGRNCGGLALSSGIAGQAELILTPECPISAEKIISKINALIGSGKTSFLVVATEGSPANLLRSISPTLPQKPTMITLGHLQRGGSPVAQDRILASRFAEMAVSLLVAGESDKLITITGGTIGSIPVSSSAGKVKGLSEDLLGLCRKLSIV